MAARQAFLQGMGLSVLPDFVIAKKLAYGRMVQVLPQWRLPSGGIHAASPAARFRPAKVKAFVQVLMQQAAFASGK